MILATDQGWANIHQIKRKKPQSQLNSSKMVVCLKVQLFSIEEPKIHALYNLENM